MSSTAVAVGAPPRDHPELVFLPGGSGGGGRRYDHRYWTWPLPPAGPLTLACEWPAAGIALTHSEIETGQLLAAAGQGERL